MGFTLFYIEPLSKGRHKQGCQEIMANPAGAKAGEPYQNLDVESQLSESIKFPCQRLARDLGSGLRPLLMKKGSGLMEYPRGHPRMGFGGIPQREVTPRCVV